jgi:hypothetical protein
MQRLSITNIYSSISITKSGQLQKLSQKSLKITKIFFFLPFKPIFRLKIMRFSLFKNSLYYNEDISTQKSFIAISKLSKLGNEII